MALQIDSLHLTLDITGYFLQNMSKKVVLGHQSVKDGLARPKAVAVSKLRLLRHCVPRNDFTTVTARE